MNVKRIYGGLNIEFEGKQFVNFAILDRACDECISKKDGCDGCEEVEKPWNEYYQFLRYDMKGNILRTYEKDPTEAIKIILKMLQSYIDSKEEKVCADMGK